MNKKINYFIILFIFFTGCSFDSKSGIWDGVKKEKKRLLAIEKKQASGDNTRVYSSNTYFSEEVIPSSEVNLSEAKKNSFWKMNGLNLQNSTGNSYLTGIQNRFLKKKIGKDKFDISNIVMPPLVSGKNIIVTDDLGTIFNINKDGKINWKTNIYKKIHKRIYKNLSLFIKKDKIYITDNIGFVYVIELRNGDLVWKKNVGVPIKSNIKVLKNKIFLINQDNRIFCLSTKDGSNLWDLRATSSFIKSQNFLGLAISKQEDLVVLTSSGDLFKIKTSNGQVTWSLKISSLINHDSDFFMSSNILLSEDEIIFSASNTLFNFNLSSGYLNWKKNVSSIGTPIIDRNYILIVSTNGYFINFDKNSGNIIWSTDIFQILDKKNFTTRVTGYVLGSDKMIATTSNGYLIESSGTTGKVISSKKVGNSINAPPIVSGGSLYILTDNSRILGFN